MLINATSIYRVTGVTIKKKKKIQIPVCIVLFVVSRLSLLWYRNDHQNQICKTGIFYDFIDLF